MKMHKTAEMEKPRPTRKPSPRLGKLAKRMVDSNDPTETAELNEAMVRGFYGNKPHA